MPPHRPNYPKDDYAANSSGLLQSEDFSAPTSQHVTTLEISPTRLIRQFLWITVALIILSTIGQIARHIYQRNNLLGLVDLFYVDAEANIPTAYSTFAWLLCSAAAAMIALIKQQTGDRNAKHWRGFALVFAYLTLDEIAAIHELFSQLRRVLPVSGILHFAWIIPGAIFFLIFAVSSFKFLYTLPLKTRNLLMLAGGVFITGAIGMEMIGGWYASTFNSQSDLPFALITTVEEALEMSGVLVLLYALLSYLADAAHPLQIRILRR
jgi:hypothetical protein